MRIEPVFFEANFSSANLFYKPVSCGITPKLTILRAIDRIQTDPDFTPPFRYDYRVTINDVHHLGFRKAFYF